MNHNENHVEHTTSLLCVVEAEDEMEVDEESDSGSEERRLHWLIKYLSFTHIFIIHYLLIIFTHNLFYKLLYNSHNTLG